MNSEILVQIHPDEAIELLLAQDIDYEMETISLDDALGRVAAENIYSKVNVPPFDRSPYDGYAFRGEDTIGASKDRWVELEVIEEIPAGTWPKYEISSGTAAKILTGGPVPEGANVCIKYEETELIDNKVRIFREIQPNTDIVYMGEDRKKDEVIIEKGDVLNTGEIGELASQGISKVVVYRKPVVGIFNMGSELTPPEERLKKGKIYNSNYNALRAFLENIGMEVIDFGIIKDDEELVEQKTIESLSLVDILITTGGASVGDYDYALSSIKNIGAKVLFWKTAMKPGGSIVVSNVEEKIVFGLSGNPAAALLSLYRVGLPFLYKACGRRELKPEAVNVFLKEDLDKNSPAVRLLRGQLEIDNGKVYFAENKEQGNGVVSSFVKCDAFAEIPMGSKAVSAGTLVKAYRVGSLFGSVGE